MCHVNLSPQFTLKSYHFHRCFRPGKLEYTVRHLDFYVFSLDIGILTWQTVVLSQVKRMWRLYCPRNVYFFKINFLELKNCTRVVNNNGVWQILIFTLWKIWSCLTANRLTGTLMLANMKTWQNILSLRR